MIRFNLQKIKYLISGITIGTIISTSAIALADNPIKLFINDKQISTDVSPVMIEGRVLVPVRVVSENLNCDVEWDQQNNTVKITSESSNNSVNQVSSIPTVKEVTNTNMSTEITTTQTTRPAKPPLPDGITWIDYNKDDGKFYIGTLYIDNKCKENGYRLQYNIKEQKWQLSKNEEIVLNDIPTTMVYSYDSIEYNYYVNTIMPIINAGN